jgi:hypothetical protein
VRHAIHQPDDSLIQPKRDTMSEKKRKRREENGERPKKKVAVAPKDNVQVELLENEGTLGPLLGRREALHVVVNHQF